LISTRDSHPHMTAAHPSSGETKHIDLDVLMMKTDVKYMAQFIELKAKAKLFAGGIRHGIMQRYDATPAYNLYYLGIIGDTLSATRLSVAQCKIIQSPVICATLNKMGIHIVFGLKHLGGWLADTSTLCKASVVHSTSLDTSRTMP
jgi:hypothetical protein